MISLNLSGEVGHLVMAQFDEDFMEKCKESRLHIDHNDLVQTISAGSKVGEMGQVEYKKKWEAKDIAEDLP